MQQDQDTRSSAGATDAAWRRQRMWVEFCATNYAKVRGYFLAQVNSPDDADDLVQEVFAEVTARREMPRDLYAYVYTVARNHLVRYWRRTRKSSATMQAAPLRCADEGNAGASASDSALTEDATQRQFREVMCIAKARLPAKSVEVVHMRFAEGLSARQMARRTGCSVDAVHKRLQRATRTLRRIVRESTDSGDL